MIRQDMNLLKRNKKEDLMRKKTDSMTELCKDIAREQIKEHMSFITSNMRLVVMKECKEAIDRHVQCTHSEVGKGPRTGDIWNKTEDHMLDSSLELMINMLATQHGRSATAIKCRLRDKVFS